MKNLRKLCLGIVLLTLFTLTACLDTKNYNYKMNNDVTDGNVVVTVKGDKVINYSTNIEIKSYAKSNLETLKYLYNMYYGSLKGVKYTIDYNESKQLAKIKLDIDLTKADIKELYKKRILIDKEVKYITLKDIEKILSTQGYKRVK
jgi:lipoprotein